MGIPTYLHQCTTFSKMANSFSQQQRILASKIYTIKIIFYLYSPHFALGYSLYLGVHLAQRPAETLIKCSTLMRCFMRKDGTRLFENVWIQLDILRADSRSLLHCLSTVVWGQGKILQPPSFVYKKWLLTLSQLATMNMQTHISLEYLLYTSVFAVFMGNKKQQFKGTWNPFKPLLSTPCIVWTALNIYRGMMVDPSWTRQHSWWILL